MSEWLGNFNTDGSDSIVSKLFSTHDAAGANVAPASAFENTDIRIYKAATDTALSATQRTGVVGVTMTSPFDSLVGLHLVTIDLTSNDDAGFYTAGHYWIVLAPDETVDSQTITGVVLARFSIGLPEVNTTHIGGTSQTGRDIGASVLLSSGTGTGQLLLSSGVASATLANTAHGGTSATLRLGGSTSTPALYVTNSGGDAVQFEATGGNGKGLDLLGNGSGDGMMATGGATGDGLRAFGGATSGDGATFYAQTDGNGIVAAGTGTLRAGISATSPSAGISISGTSDGVGLKITGEGTGDGVLIQAGATGDGVTIEGGATSGDGLVLTGDNPLGTDAVTQIRDSVVAIFVDDLGTAQAGASGSITLRSGAVSTDDYYNNAVVTITGGTGAGQSRQITDYVGSTRVASVDTNWVTTPDNTSEYLVLGRVV